MEISEILMMSVGFIITLGIQTILLIKYVDKKAHDRDLQESKSKLDGKLHVTKTRFDAEFIIYRELSRSFFEMLLASVSLFPLGLVNVPADKEIRENQEKENYTLACNANVKAQNSLYENMPFISESLDTQFREMLKLCRLQVSLFGHKYSLYNSDYFSRNQDEGFRRSEEIMAKWDSLCNSMREYLSSLDVAE